MAVVSPCCEVFFFITITDETLVISCLQKLIKLKASAIFKKGLRQVV